MYIHAFSLTAKPKAANTRRKLYSNPGETVATNCFITASPPPMLSLSKFSKRMLQNENGNDASQSNIDENGVKQSRDRRNGGSQPYMSGRGMVQLQNGSYAINDVTDRDYGTYQCTATNQFGTVSATFDLVKPSKCTSTCISIK